MLSAVYLDSNHKRTFSLKFIYAISSRYSIYKFIGFTLGVRNMEKSWSVDETTIQRFRDTRQWHGSHYELGMAYNPDIFDRHQRAEVLRLLWDDPSVVGVVVDRWHNSGSPWQPVADVFIPNQHYYGCFRLLNGQVVGCGSCLIETKDIIWVTFYIPVAMLEAFFSIKYPVVYPNNSWIAHIDPLLARIGMRIYRQAPFLIGVIGEEAAAIFEMNDLLLTLERNGGLLVPEIVFENFGVDPYGERSPEGLWWTGGKNHEAR
jgi:hypothetical protein